MKFHHYLEAIKLRENSRDLLKTRGKLGSQFWGGGLIFGVLARIFTPGQKRPKKAKIENRALW